MDNSQQRRGIRITVAVVLCFVLVFAGLFAFRLHRANDSVSLDALKQDGVFVYEKPRIIPEFTLVDKQGGDFTLQQLQGGWSLLFFGFTFCPDVCPTTLVEMDLIKKALKGSSLENVGVVLVSVDPARDTPEQLSQYLDFFNPEFQGVTGEFTDLFRFATQLNAAFRKVPGGGDKYLVDHSANIVMINPRGHYQGFIKPPFDSEKVASQLLQVEKYYQQIQ